MGYDKVSIGANIRALRNKLGLTQSEFAEKLGVFQPNVVEFERGVISIKLLCRIADTFGVETSELLKERDA